MAEKTSLEKSHSKASNFKLTMICLLGSIAAALFWCGLVLVSRESLKITGIILTALGAVISILTFFLIGKFTR